MLYVMLCSCVTGAVGVLEVASAFFDFSFLEVAEQFSESVASLFEEAADFFF